MGILQTLKSVFGIGTSNQRRHRETRITVEREPETEPDLETERAVKNNDITSSKVDTPEEAEAPSVPVDDIKGIGPAYAERLTDAGIETVAELANANAAELAAATDIPESRLQTWIDRANAR